MTDKQWARSDKAAWNKAAKALEADGWKRDGDKYLCLFTKDGETVYLGRKLGTLDWRPIPATDGMVANYR